MAAPQTPSLDKNHPKMRQVDLASDHLSPEQRKLINSYNSKQFEVYRKKFSYRNKIMAACILGLSASVYGYTVYQLSKDKDLIAEMENEVMDYNEKR